MLRDCGISWVSSQSFVCRKDNRKSETLSPRKHLRKIYQVCRFLSVKHLVCFFGLITDQSLFCNLEKKKDYSSGHAVPVSVCSSANYIALICRVSIKYRFRVLFILYFNIIYIIKLSLFMTNTATGTPLPFHAIQRHIFYTYIHLNE